MRRATGRGSVAPDPANGSKPPCWGVFPRVWGYRERGAQARLECVSATPANREQPPLPVARNPYGMGFGELVGRLLQRDRVFRAGALGTLAVQSVRSGVRPPFTWLPEATAQLSYALRRYFIPMSISVAGYMFGYMIVVFGVVLHDLGVIDRQAGGIFIGLIREVCVWITTMIFAGVAGSAICADLASAPDRAAPPEEVSREEGVSAGPSVVQSSRGPRMPRTESLGAVRSIFSHMSVMLARAR